MKVVFTTGGTGGHIYPAIALAKRLKKVETDADISFIGTSNHMEKAIVEATEFDFYGYELSSGLKGKLDKFKQILQLVFATLKVYFKFLFNRPNLVIGFGAYVTAPALLAAKFLKIPIMLHEQNSSMGRVNEMFYKTAKDVVVCYPSLLEKYPSEKVKLLGNPRASEVKDFQKNTDQYLEFGLLKNKLTILIVMGSQGSETVNDTMFELLPMFNEENFQVIYVTGAKHYDLYTDALTKNNVVVKPFVNQGDLLASVDLVIARGGATTAAEICALGVPSIIIPSPFVANNHQYINALQLEEVGATTIIKEENLNAKILLEEIRAIINDKEKIKSMKKAALSLSTPNASDDIIELIRKYKND